MAHSTFNIEGVGAAQTGEAITVPGSSAGTYVFHNAADSVVNVTINGSAATETITASSTSSVDVEVDNDGTPSLAIRAQAGSTLVFQVAKSDAGNGTLTIATGATNAHGSSAQNGETVYLGRV